MNKANLMMRSAVIFGTISTALFVLIVIFWKTVAETYFSGSYELIILLATSVSLLCGIISVIMAIVGRRLGADVRNMGVAIIPVIISGLSVFYIVFTVVWFFITLMFCGLFTSCKHPWVDDVFNFLIGWL